ncbi:MAG: hypothetical protein AAGC60_27730 [Acidobacteriota bacterium]
MTGHDLPTIERWRRAFARRSAVDTAVDPATDTTPTPVEPDTIWRAVRGELPAAETRALVDRLVDDPELAREWRLAHELVQSLDTTDAAGSDDSVGDREGTVSAFPVAPAVDAPRRWRPRAMLAAAAMLFLGLAAFLLLDTPEPTPPIWRGEDVAIESALPAATVLPRDAAELRWRGPEVDDDATVRWSVDVLSETLEPVSRATDLDTPHLLLELSRLEPFADGTVLLWRVTARIDTADGEDVVRSTTFRTTLGPAHSASGGASGAID